MGARTKVKTVSFLVIERHVLTNAYCRCRAERKTQTESSVRALGAQLGMGLTMKMHKGMQRLLKKILRFYIDMHCVGHLIQPGVFAQAQHLGVVGVLYPSRQRPIARYSRLNAPVELLVI